MPSGDRSASIPADVSNFGTVETTWVKSQLDGRRLFEIASPQVDRNDPGDRLPVEIRAQQITKTLDRAVVLFYVLDSRSKDTASLSELPVVSVDIAKLNNLPLLVARPTNANDDERRLRLLTVTNFDAEYHAKSKDSLAEEWQTLLETEINREIHLLQPRVIWSRLRIALLILLGAVLCSLAIALLQWLFKKRHRWLKQRQQEAMQSDLAQENFDKETQRERSAEADSIAKLRMQFLQTLPERFHFQALLGRNQSWQWLLFWLQVILWYVSLLAIITSVPYLMKYRPWLLEKPLEILIIFFGASCVIRLSRSIVNWISKNWQQSERHFLGDSQREALRRSTITSSVKGLLTFLLIIVAVVWILDALEVPTSSIVAGGAILGLAVSFGSQNLIRDLVNGFLILIEDQFAVGDVVMIQDSAGLVENLNFRVTQLRDGEGKLITIPNSSIITVKNLTRQWSRVDFEIEIAYEADLEQALELLRTISTKMYAEPDWRDRILEPPEVLGVDRLSHEGMLLKVWIKTAPLQQWSVGREFRYRVRLGLEAEGIEIGKPQWVGRTVVDSRNGQRSEDDRLLSS